MAEEKARLVPLRYEDLSSLGYRLFDLPRPDGVHVLVIEYLGEFGTGAKPRGDARFIVATALAALEAWSRQGLILDFSELAYAWGDDMAAVFELAWDRATRRPRPFAVVTGPCSRDGLERLQEGEEPTYLAPDLSAALAMVEAALAT